MLLRGDKSDTSAYSDEADPSVLPQDDEGKRIAIFSVNSGRRLRFPLRHTLSYRETKTCFETIYDWEFVRSAWRCATRRPLPWLGTKGETTINGRFGFRCSLLRLSGRQRMA